MVRIIIHIAYITCLVTNDVIVRHAYDVIEVYKILHGDGRILYFGGTGNTVVGCTVMGEVVARNI